MKSYKIKVVTKTESKEAQEFLFELGYGWSTHWKHVAHKDYSYLFAKDGNISMSNSESLFLESSAHQEITLPQLRDLVVLHRNDVGDATHTDNVNKFYIGDANVFQYHDSVWLKCSDLITPKLKPLNKQSQMTWQDALRAVVDWKEVEMKWAGDWYKAETVRVNNIRKGESFRLAPQRKTLNGNFTKEELLKIVGEME